MYTKYRETLLKTLRVMDLTWNHEGGGRHAGGKDDYYRTSAYFFTRVSNYYSMQALLQQPRILNKLNLKSRLKYQLSIPVESILIYILYIGTVKKIGYIASVFSVFDYILGSSRIISYLF